MLIYIIALFFVPMYHFDSFASVSARMWSMVTNVNVHWDGLGQTVISTSMIVHPILA